MGKNKRSRSLEHDVADEECPSKSSVKLPKKKKKKSNEFNSTVDELHNSHDDHNNNMFAKNHKQLSAADEDEQDEHIIVPELPVSLKKKKKSRKSSSHHEKDNEFNSLENITSSSTKKKKSKQPKQNQEEDNMTKWEEAEGTKLLDLCAKKLRKKARCSLAQDYKKLDFTQISTNFENKTSKDCLSHLQFLVDKLRKRKNLHQLVSEVIDEGYSNVVNGVNRQLLPYVQWYRANKPEVLRQMKLQGLEATMLNITSFSRNSFNALPQEEKDKYEIHIKKKKLKVENSKKDRSTKLSLIGLAKSPFEMFAQKKREVRQNEEEELPSKELKKMFQELKDRKKIRFIKASFDSNDDEKKANPDVKIPASKQPLLEEADLYLKSVEAPVPECKNKEIYHLKIHENKIYEKFLKDSTSQTKRSSNFVPSTIFNKLSLQKRREAEESFKEYTIKFLEDVDEWKKEQGPTIVEFYNKMKKYGKVVEVMLHPKERKERVQKKREPPTPPMCVEMPSVVTCFDREPAQPPTTPADLYCYKMNIKGSKSHRLQHYKDLNDKVKIELVAKHKRMIENYKEKLLEYVAELSSDKAIRDFLGLRRKSLKSWFKIDIFQSIYPVGDYPLYNSEKTKPSAVDQYLEKGDREFILLNQSIANSPSKKSSEEEERSETPDSEDSEDDSSLSKDGSKTPPEEEEEFDEEKDSSSESEDEPDVVKPRKLPIKDSSSSEDEDSD